MPRSQEPFSLVRRPGSPYWYYKLAPWKTCKSTGKTVKADAISVALEALEKEAETPVGQPSSPRRRRQPRIRCC